jgi:hypothetical protein
MQSATQYRIYAEECRKLAQRLKPEHRDVLLAIADAWDKCADEFGAAPSRGDGADHDRER